MGAWIEISFILYTLIVLFVAPYMGAWIEMTNKFGNLNLVSVAPYMGAWIEIYTQGLVQPLYNRRTLHGCVD